MSKIYRKASMERLSSPEQLDRLIKITSPAVWLTLAGGGIIIVGIIFWSFFGNLPKTIGLSGIFMTEEFSVENVFENKSDGMVVISYVPLTEGKKLKEGMNVYITPSNINEQEYGHIEGIIDKVAVNPATTDEMFKNLKNESVVNVFQQQGPVMEIKISLLEDKTSSNGYKWSNRKGRDLIVTGSTFASIRVLLESEAPISRILPI